MVSNAVNARWDTLLRWTLGKPDLEVSKCVQDIQALSGWTNGTDVVSVVWQALFGPEVSLAAAADKFVEFKRRLLVYLEKAPSNASFTVEQLQGIQKLIDANTTLVEMWNCTKIYYFNEARKGRVHKEFPDYVFGFSGSGTLIERVGKIKEQIDELNRPRSAAFSTTTYWALRNTNLTHAFVPKIIASQFINIQFLDMCHNKFDTLGNLSHLRQLEVLSLTNNRLRKIAGAHLPVSLKQLDLDRNHLEIAPDLTRLTRLTSLDVSTNRLDEVPSENLPRSLEQLDVRNTLVNSVVDIQAAFPALEIECDSDVETNPMPNSHVRPVVRHPAKRTKI